MNGKRNLVHTSALFLLPLIVAMYGISFAGTVGLVLLALLWRWGLSLGNWVWPPRMPELELRTISASHYVEKVRWCMDRLGVAYTETKSAGTLTAFYLGYSVPRLLFRTGAVRSTIGNSAEILRYLWGRYAAEMPEQAAFLEPTPERLELEKRIDRCGRDLQVWIYFHILDHPAQTKRAWGCEDPEIPAWQRSLLKLLFPLQSFMIRKVFRISPGRHAKAVEHLDALMDDVEKRLEDGRGSILGGDTVNFSDYTYAAIMGLWLQPEGYGGGRAEHVRIAREDYPPAMAKEIERWAGRYPRGAAFIQSMYESRGRN